MDIDLLKKEIVRISHLFYHRRWSLATSSNYSAQLNGNSMLITASGKDKGTLTEQDILLMNLDGIVTEPTGLKPSAESHLHCALYRSLPQIGAVLHTHSVFATVLSSLPTLKAPFTISGYEMLKALDGVKTHLHTEQLPVFANDQDMTRLSRAAQEYLKRNLEIHGFLIAGHGLYAWGKDLSEALRHVEAFEFLLECEYQKMCLR